MLEASQAQRRCGPTAVKAELKTWAKTIRGKGGSPVRSYSPNDGLTPVQVSR